MKRATCFFVSLLGALSNIASAQSPTDLEVQVGQHVIYSYPGLTPPDHLFDLISQGKVGGIIIFGENVSDDLPGTIERFLTTYRESPAYLGTPLLIMTDQEGGQIRRLPGGPELSAKQVGESEDPNTAAAESGQDAADTLKEYNVNVNLAPVVDVYRKAGDLMDRWGRSYSNNATVVAGCASNFIDRQQGASVLATAKHFPGLGAAGTRENTDDRPVTIRSSLNTIRSVDELPYVSAIQENVAMVMPSWAVYPALDPERPAGLSSRWIEDELRTRLGFKGAIISDAIEAGALEAFGNHDNRAALAKQAGVDIILASGRNVTQGESIVRALGDALRNGFLSQEALDASSERVQKVRAQIA